MCKLSVLACCRFSAASQAQKFSLKKQQANTGTEAPSATIVSMLKTVSPDELPTALRPLVTDWLAENADEQGLGPLLDAHPELAAQLPIVVACSQYCADTIARYPELLSELLANERLNRSLATSELQDLFTTGVSVDLTESQCEQALRRLRHRELVRIAWRDLNDQASLDETLRDLSALADASICAALRWSLQALNQNYGQALEEDGQPAKFLILGMGKLGGGELNFSSDVDLIFLYSDRGETDGRRKISNEQYFRALGQRIVSLLNKQTADGFVYRVDVRLRPFGDSGPLAVSVSALEAYLLRHGRDWERYAYVKARVINHWEGTPELYDNVLRPFIYRRYLDYGVFESLREMKAMIEAEVRRKEFENHLKLGPGGIREIEFIVQSLQLVRGGMYSDLRVRSLVAAIEALVRHEILTKKDAEELITAYRFLRRMENRLQSIADQQTHDLPTSDLNQARLALATGFANWPDLLSALNAQREIVSGHFRNIVFRAANEVPADSTAEDFAMAWARGLSPQQFDTLLGGFGYSDPQAARERLESFRDSGSYLRMDEGGRKRLNALMPRLIEEAGRQTNAWRALDRGMQVVEAIGRRSAYFSLLNENPVALQRLLRLCSESDFLAKQLAAHPMLLDELLDPRIFADLPDRAGLQEDLRARLTAVDDMDSERAQFVLSHFQHAALFRIAVADLSGSLPLMKVSDRLTDVAEIILQATLDFCWHELTLRHGSPQCVDDGVSRPARFAVIAYGKLGGLELGYGSDLDLVFLHDSTGEHEETDGDQPLDNGLFFSRLTRRMIHWLTISTAAGSLYEVDTRLRPSGGSGLLVTSLVGFERYQREDAWTWEHQALLRSRAVAGDPGVCAAFEKMRRQVLIENVRRESLRTDVADMRTRMRAELTRGTDELFDLKQDSGGIADIEFIVQYLVLRDAHECAELLNWSDNIRQLESLAEHGYLIPEQADCLANTYRDFRARVHHLSLAGEPPLVAHSQVADLVKAVHSLWQSIFG